MQSHKLVLDSLFDEGYKLIAVHSSLEEYRMAFLLNKVLNIQLARAKKDIDFKHKKVLATYSLYKFYDESNMNSYYLFNNKFRGKNAVPQAPALGGLFEGAEEAVTTFLVPEYKRVDYMLKIEGDPSEGLVKELVKKINKVPNVGTAYQIEPDQIKNQENLIFD